MTILRIFLSLFAIINVVFWAVLAWSWAVKPGWAGRIPFGLGTDQRFIGPVPNWARLAAAIASFWAVAGVLYLTVYESNRLAVAGLFVMAAIFLILGIGAAARVFQVLQMPKSPTMPQPRQQKRAS